MHKMNVKSHDSNWMDRTTLTVEETAAVLGIGRSAAYEGVRTGQIPHIKIGKRLIVPVVALRALLEGRDR